MFDPKYVFFPKHFTPRGHCRRRPQGGARGGEDGSPPQTKFPQNVFLKTFFPKGPCSRRPPGGAERGGGGWGEGGGAQLPLKQSPKNVFSIKFSLKRPLQPQAARGCWARRGVGGGYCSPPTKNFPLKKKFPKIFPEADSGCMPQGDARGEREPGEPPPQKLRGAKRQLSINNNNSAHFYSAITSPQTIVGRFTKQLDKIRIIKNGAQLVSAELFPGPIFRTTPDPPGSGPDPTSRANYLTRPDPTHAVPDPTRPLTRPPPPPGWLVT